MSDNIKVAIKVRPLIKREKDDNLPIQWVVQENTIISADPEIKKRGDSGFQFDHIFDMGMSNSTVFDTVAMPIVDAAVNGFNGTIFAYGQTSSGKTYTMMGSEEEPGIIPLAVKHMFDAIANTLGREFLLRVSYLEIYNERVNDLLNKDNTDLKIHEDTSGQVIVKCREEVTNCPENVLALMKKGDKIRRIGETNMNERSSRSHTIFRITIESREAGGSSDSAIQVSQLNLVDLAGSERARQTGATGERFKEGRHINLSLSTLSLVIMQLSESHENQKYVNFRDSKLTRLLQVSLGGNALTAIICAVTPAAFEETQCTLLFASRARSIKNKPQLNEVVSEAALLKRYAKQLSKLNAELEKLKQENRSAEVEEMESRLQEKDRINQLLEERIELLKTRIVSADNNPSHEESFRSKSCRRRTWGGPRTHNSIPMFKSSADIPTIARISPNESKRKSIIQSVDIMNRTFQTEFTDFELELIESERAREEVEIDIEERGFVTKRSNKNRVKFEDDVCVYRPNYYSYDVTPEKQIVSRQSSDSSPGTPEDVLREDRDNTRKELDELREFTTLEKQSIIEGHCCTNQEELQKAQDLEKQLEKISNERNEYERVCMELRKQLKRALDKGVENEKNTEKLAELRKQLENVNSEKADFEHICCELRKELREAKQEKTLLLEKEAKNSEELQRIPILEKQLENVASEKIEFETMLNSLRKDLRERDAQLLENEGRMQKVTELEKKLANHVSEKAEYERVIAEMQKDLAVATSKEQKVTEEKSQNSQNLQKISELEEELKTLKTENSRITELESKIATLTLEKAALQNEPRNSPKKLQQAELEKPLIVINADAECQTCEEEDNTIELKQQIESLLSERSELQRISTELREKLVEVELLNQHHDGSPRKLTETEVQVSLEFEEKAELERKIIHLENQVKTLTRENLEREELESKTLKAKLSHQSSLINQELDVSNDDLTKSTEALISVKSALEDNARLSAKLELKVQELDEFKNNVRAIKLGIGKLHKIIYLSPTEDVTSSGTKDHPLNKETENNLEKTIDELYTTIFKISDEKIDGETNDSKIIFEEEPIKLIKPKSSEDNKTSEGADDEIKKTLLEYQNKIEALTAENIELSLNLTEKGKELESIKESKSLLFDHDCIYKDKIEVLLERNQILKQENIELSTDVMDKVEENDALKKDHDILVNKLDVLLKNDSSENDIQQLRSENNRFKAEIVELESKVNLLTEENSRLHSNLLEIEDSSKANISESRNNSLHSSTMIDSILNESSKEKPVFEETESLANEVLTLKEKVKHLTRLNKKLTDLKLSPCGRCIYLKELHGSRRSLKFEVKALTQNLENMQRKYDEKCADVEHLKSKVNEDLNLSEFNISLNASALDDMNVTCLEETIKTVTNQLEDLNEEYDKIMNLYKKECIEFEKLSENAELIGDAEIQSKSKKPTKDASKVENLQKQLDIYKEGLKKMKKSEENMSESLKKFMKERSSLFQQINSLQNTNAELLTKISTGEAAIEKVQILQNEVTDLCDKLEKYSSNEKEMQNERVLLEIEIERLNEENDNRDSLIKQLREITDDLQKDLSSKAQELNSLAKCKEELINSSRLIEAKYKDEIQTILRTNKDLTESKNRMELLYKDELNSVLKSMEEIKRDSQDKLRQGNETVNQITAEKERLQKELTILQDIEKRYNLTTEENKRLQNVVANQDAKKLRDELYSSKNCIIKEIKSLIPKANGEDLLNKPVEELFVMFFESIVLKEGEVIKSMKEDFEKNRRKLEEEKQQSADAEKRVSNWAKELECDIDKLQDDITKQKNLSMELKEKILQLEHSLKETSAERDMLKDKLDSMEADFSNLQAEFERNTKVEVKEEAISVMQKREREIILKKEAELQSTFKSEKETYERRIEELISAVESHKTKNLELRSNIEGLEANEKQLKNIIDVKAYELMKNKQRTERVQSELQQLTETYNELSQELQNKETKIVEITGLLKTKCDMLSEYRAKFDNIVPEYENLKEQASERKLYLERCKTELESLKSEKEKEIELIKDKLNSEEIKSTGLNKQLTELSNKNVALVTEIEALKERCEDLQAANEKLEKKVRNSTSKIKVEAEMEELKDLNRNLQNNLEGASNRIAELQDSKNQTLKELVNLKGQYELMLQENVGLKTAVSTYKTKINNSGLDVKKYDDLLQEKNQIALELEGKKLLLSQREKDLENYKRQIDEMNTKNEELDVELEEMAEVIRQQDAQNAKLEDKLHCYLAENNVVSDLESKINCLTEENKRLESELKSKVKTTVKYSTEDAKQVNQELREEIKTLHALKKEHSKLRLKINELENKLEVQSNSSDSRCASPVLPETNRRRRSRNEVFNQRRHLDVENTDGLKKCGEDNEEKCKILREKIHELELNLVSKNGKIATLEMQIQSENFPYERKCKDLEENLLAFKKKNEELKSEVKRLRKAMIDISARECDVCRRWRVENRRDQVTQTVPNAKIRFCSTSSGVVDDHMKMLKLEKDNAFMKEICRSRSSRIKKLEEKIKELESSIPSPGVLQPIETTGIQENTSFQPQTTFEKAFRQTTKENVPANLLESNLSTRRRRYNQ